VLIIREEKNKGEKIIRRLIIVLGCILLITQLLGCASLKSIFKPRGRVDNAAMLILPPYSGPKAHIEVSDFEVKAAKADSEIGSAMHDMLVTTLIKSNRFSVVSRQEVSAALQEQELNNLSVVATPVKPQKSKIKAADLVISATISEFEPRPSGGASGVGGGGGGSSSGILNALLGVALSNKTHIVLDFRILDNSTSGVIAAGRVQGQASDISGAIMTDAFGDLVLGPKLSAYANTPMEKAIRLAVIEATRFISQAIPAQYYKD
jgi:curli biogenesis system outer membrane secretion channel CsgG